MSSNDPNPEFVRLVRSALAYLYDHAHMQNHALVSILDLDTKGDRVTRSQELRRILLDCIEAIGPDNVGAGQSETARAYAILTYRYVDGLSMEEITEKLALSQRQTYREHRRGVKAVASLLWDFKQANAKDSPPSPTVAGNRLEAAQIEIERFQHTINAELLQLQPILEDVLALLALRSQQTGIQINLLSPDTWPLLIVDRVMMRQALLNLLSYALDVAHRNLAVSVTHKQDEIQIEVYELEEPGQLKPDALTTRKREGVSLTVTKSLIEAQGGRFDFGEQAGRWRARIGIPPPDRPTVLVIDDNADILALIRRYMAGHNVSVIGTTDGAKAPQMAAELQPRVITLDVMMPSQDGWEILQQLKTAPDTQHIPVIICSILDEPQLAQSIGASGYITKPVDQIELLETLQQHLGALQPGA